MFEKIAEKLYEECGDKSKGIMDVSIILASEFDITQGTDSFADLVCLVRDYRNGSKGLSETSQLIFNIYAKPTSCDISVSDTGDPTEEEKLYIESHFNEPREVFALIKAFRMGREKLNVRDIKCLQKGLYSVPREYKGSDGTWKKFRQAIHVEDYDSYRKMAIEERAQLIGQNNNYLYALAEFDVNRTGVFGCLGFEVLLSEKENEDGFIVACCK